MILKKEGEGIKLILQQCSTIIMQSNNLSMYPKNWLTAGLFSSISTMIIVVTVCVLGPLTSLKKVPEAWTG